MTVKIIDRGVLGNILGVSLVSDNCFVCSSPWTKQVTFNWKGEALSKIEKFCLCDYHAQKLTGSPNIQLVAVLEREELEIERERVNR